MYLWDECNQWTVTIIDHTKNFKSQFYVNKHNYLMVASNLRFGVLQLYQHDSIFEVTISFMQNMFWKSWIGCFLCSIACIVDIVSIGFHAKIIRVLLDHISRFNLLFFYVWITLVVSIIKLIRCWQQKDTKEDPVRSWCATIS